MPTMQDSATAKKLAFHKDVHTRCITLEGDDFNPGGLLTGKRMPGAELQQLNIFHCSSKSQQRIAWPDASQPLTISCSCHQGNRMPQPT